jgi:hypothetical protein
MTQITKTIQQNYKEAELINDDVFILILNNIRDLSPMTTQNKQVLNIFSNIYKLKIMNVYIDTIIKTINNISAMYFSDIFNRKLNVIINAYNSISNCNKSLHHDTLLSYSNIIKYDSIIESLAQLIDEQPTTFLH